MYEGDVEPGERKVLVTETIGDFLGEIVTAPATLSTDSTLRDAIDAILQSGSTRKAYVLDDAGVLKGTISIETLMRHVADRLGARPPGIVSWLRFVKDMESDNASDFMTKPVPVSKKTLIVDLVRRVVGEHLNDFPVLDDDGRLIGEVNSFSLLKIARSAFPEKPPEPSRSPPVDPANVTPSGSPTFSDQIDR
jgi:CBS domain-containing protein